MIAILKFLKEYWVLITFFIGEILVLIKYITSINNGIKCTLRNDIVEIYELCKDTKEITYYQYQTVCLSYEEYKKLKGNSFIDGLMEKIKTFTVI